MSKKEDTRFRGNWSPQIRDPKPQSFVPAPKPTPKPVPKPSPPPPKEEPKPEPPPAVHEIPDGAINILNRYNDPHGYIDPDTGECFNVKGMTIGFINMEDWNAGSADEEFLGELLNDNSIYNADGDHIGNLDLGHATILDLDGNTIVQMENTGAITGNNSTYLGQFEPFSFRDMKTIALYLMLIDFDMTNDRD